MRWLRGILRAPAGWRAVSTISTTASPSGASSTERELAERPHDEEAGPTSLIEMVDIHQDSPASMRGSMYISFSDSATVRTWGSRDDIYFDIDSASDGESTTDSVSDSTGSLLSVNLSLGSCQDTMSLVTRQKETQSIVQKIRSIFNR